MRRLLLVFASANTEREFLKSRTDDLTRGMSWWTALGALFCGVTYFAGGEVDRSAWSTPMSAVVERRRDWGLLGGGLWCSAAFVFFRVARNLPCVGPERREAAATLWIATGLLMVPLLERFYFAKASGYDPYEIYPGVSFDDATVLLLVSSMVTAGHLIVPIRWRTLSAVEALGVLTYAACCVSGTPGDASKGRYNLFCLAIQGLMVAIGKRTLEYHERRAFLHVIKEKRLRCQTEFQLSRPGGGLASVSEGEGPGGASTGSAQASQRTASNSEVSFSLSDSVASSGAAAAQPPHPAACTSQEVGVQTSGQAADEGRRDCATETELVWAADAFQCKRCSARPPLHTPPPPPEEVPEHYFCRVCRGRRRRRRGARSDGDANACSSTSSTTCAIMEQFPLTPMRTKKEMLFMLMLQFNFAVHPDACCLYHSGVQDLYTAIKIMKGAECIRAPWETADTQCPRCYLLTDIDEDTQVCEFCSERLFNLVSINNMDADDVSI